MYELTERRNVMEVPAYQVHQVAVAPGVIDLGVHGEVEFSDWEIVIQVGIVEVKVITDE